MYEVHLCMEKSSVHWAYQLVLAKMAIDLDGWMSRYGKISTFEL